MIKALFFDVDGTLVSFDTHQVPESTIAALRAARQNGVKIFTATGRPRQLLNNIYDVEPLMDGYILATGAQCTYGDVTVREDLIPTASATTIVRYCESHGIPVVVVGKIDIQIVNRNTTVDRVFYELLKVDYHKFDVPVDEVIEQGILQITPFLAEDEESLIMPQLQGCTSARWHPAFCDITSASADKANGIKAIAECHGFTDVDAEVLGDGLYAIGFVGRGGGDVAEGGMPAC